MLKRTFLTAAAALVAATVLTGPVQAAPGDWVHLGTKQVNFLFDKDVFHVGGVPGRFRKIGLKVYGNKMFMHYMRVTFKNGGQQYVPLRFHFAQGSKTRVIDLRGYKRKIKKVTVVYSKPRNGQGRTWVKLFGKR